MLGLIKKDLFLINKNVKLFFLMLVVYGIISLDGTFDITYIIPFITIMLFTSTFSYDDFNNWNSYAVTLPCGKVNIVRSKYITGLIIAAVSILVTFFMTVVILAFTNQPINLSDITSTLIGILAGVIIVFSIMCPLIFKFGTEKGRIWLFIIIVAFVALIAICSKIINFSDLGNLYKIPDKLWYIILPIFLIVTLLSSYIVSKNIYLRKEF